MKLERRRGAGEGGGLPVPADAGDEDEVLDDAGVLATVAVHLHQPARPRGEGARHTKE